MKLDIDPDDDPHLRHLDGAEVDSYEQVGDTCCVVDVDDERVLVADHELVEEADQR